MSAQHKVDIFEAFDMDFSTLKPGAPYWRGAIRLGSRTLARTRRHNTRKAAEREAKALLKQLQP
jgi:molybdopterin synthase catalytic subunit